MTDYLYPMGRQEGQKGLLVGRYWFDGRVGDKERVTGPNKG